MEFQALGKVGTTSKQNDQAGIAFLGSANRKVLASFFGTQELNSNDEYIDRTKGFCKLCPEPFWVKVFPEFNVAASMSQDTNS